MFRSLRILVVALSTAAILVPQTAAAQDLTPDQVQAAFASAGFLVEDPLHWTWTSPSNTTSRVHDALSDRVLLVVVYPDAHAAEAAQRQAEARNNILVNNFGPATWRNNVALMQSSRINLDRQHAQEIQRSVGMISVPSDAEQATEMAVAVDFLRVLSTDGSVDL
jgi:hypothetical protein